jgi:hypothetical protein
MKKRSKAQNAAFGGVLVALSVLLLYLGAILPAAKLCLCALAAAIPALEFAQRRVRAGVLVFAAAAVIALLFLPDKNVALFYTAMLGPYTIVKYFVEGIPGQAVCWILKIAYFNIDLLVLWKTAESVLALLPERLMSHAYLVILAGNIVFVFYDMVLSKLIFYAKNRLRR